MSVLQFYKSRHGVLWDGIQPKVAMITREVILSSIILHLVTIPEMENIHEMQLITTSISSANKKVLSVPLDPLPSGSTVIQDEIYKLCSETYILGL